MKRVRKSCEEGSETSVIDDSKKSKIRVLEGSKTSVIDDSKESETSGIEDSKKSETSVIDDSKSRVLSDPRVRAFFAAHPKLEPCVTKFACSCDASFLGTGTFGIVFAVTNQNGCVAVKISEIDIIFTPHVLNDQGQLRIPVLDSIIALDGVTCLRHYNTTYSRKTKWILEQTMDLHRRQINEVITPASPPGEIINGCRDLLSCVMILYSRGLIHEDLKSANILHDGTKPVICDVDAIVKQKQYTPHSTTPPFSCWWMTVEANRLLSVFATIIQCITKKPHLFRIGYLDIFPRFMSSACVSPLDHLPSILQNILGYQQEQKVIDIMVAMMCAIALAYNGNHTHRCEFIAFINKHFPEVRIFV